MHSIYFKNSAVLIQAPINHSHDRKLDALGPPLRAAQNNVLLYPEGSFSFKFWPVKSHKKCYWSDGSLVSPDRSLSELVHLHRLLLHSLTWGFVTVTSLTVIVSPNRFIDYLKC